MTCVIRPGFTTKLQGSSCFIFYALTQLHRFDGCDLDKANVVTPVNDIVKGGTYFLSSFSKPKVKRIYFKFLGISKVQITF